MKAILPEQFPPAKSEMPQTSSGWNRYLINHRQPIYKDVARLLLTVDEGMRKNGHSRGEEVVLGHKYFGIGKRSGVVVWDFVVGDNSEGGSLPYVTHTRYKEVPSRQHSSHTLLFAESYMYPTFAAWQASYEPADAEANREARIGELRPITRTRSTELVYYLAHAAAELGLKPKDI